eukprot:g2322.t1
MELVDDSQAPPLFEDVNFVTDAGGFMDDNVGFGMNSINTFSICTQCFVRSATVECKTCNLIFCDGHVPSSCTEGLHNICRISARHATNLIESTRSGIQLDGDQSNNTDIQHGASDELKLPHNPSSEENHEDLSSRSNENISFRNLQEHSPFGTSSAMDTQGAEAHYSNYGNTLHFDQNTSGYHHQQQQQQQQQHNNSPMGFTDDRRNHQQYTNTIHHDNHNINDQGLENSRTITAPVPSRKRRFSKKHPKMTNRDMQSPSPRPKVKISSKGRRNSFNGLGNSNNSPVNSNRPARRNSANECKELWRTCLAALCCTRRTKSGQTKKATGDGQGSYSMIEEQVSSEDNSNNVTGRTDSDLKNDEEGGENFKDK